MIYCGHTKCAGGQWTHICLLLLDEGSESWPLAAFIPFSITETMVVQQSWSGAIVLRYCMDIVSRGLTAAARRNWREEESSYKLQPALSSLVWLTNSFVFPFQLKLFHTIE